MEKWLESLKRFSLLGSVHWRSEESMYKRGSWETLMSASPWQPFGQWRQHEHESLNAVKMPGFPSPAHLKTIEGAVVFEGEDVIWNREEVPLSCDQAAHVHGLSCGQSRCQWGDKVKFFPNHKMMANVTSDPPPSHHGAEFMQLKVVMIITDPDKSDWPMCPAVWSSYRVSHISHSRWKGIHMRKIRKLVAVGSRYLIVSLVFIFYDSRFHNHPHFARFKSLPASSIGRFFISHWTMSEPRNTMSRTSSRSVSYQS